MGRFYKEYLRDMSYKNASKKVERRYSMGGDWTGDMGNMMDMDFGAMGSGFDFSTSNSLNPEYVEFNPTYVSSGSGTTHLLNGSLITPTNPQYVPGTQLGHIDSTPSRDYVYPYKSKKPIKFYENGGNPTDSLTVTPPAVDVLADDNPKLDPNKPIWTPIDPDSGVVTVKPQEKIKFLLNKSGWADIEQYREKAKDSKFIKGTQDLVITDGFNIDNDGIWGNKTYNAINQDLVNKQLNAYTNPYFTDAEFTAQIFKESTGDNSKVSDKGAMGIAQFLPSTFKWAKEKGWIPETAKITDVAAQSLAQRRYMDYIYEDRENVKSATTTEERKARTYAAYNMGPGNFDKFWKKLSAKEKKAGWETWYKKMNKETKMYVLWNMDRVTYKKDYSTPYKHKRGYMTSKWNDVNYGFDRYKNKNLQYRY